ncbi:hypothetical protein HMPREF0569_1592 [Micrococcus luteus SK58]|nr:hypothetical protein HMPREF0569_1592 [Micrococcus luteus SK58]
MRQVRIGLFMRFSASAWRDQLAPRAGADWFVGPVLRSVAAASASTS